MISKIGTDVTDWTGGRGHAVARRGSVVCVPVKLVASFQLGPSNYVPTSERHTGWYDPDDCSSLEKPSNEKVIINGPATFIDETDVRMAFHVI